jgi:hypothetical protein
MHSSIRLVYFSALKMEAVHKSKMLVNLYWTTHYIPDDSLLRFLITVESLNSRNSTVPVGKTAVLLE